MPIFQIDFQNDAVYTKDWLGGESNSDKASWSQKEAGPSEDDEVPQDHPQASAQCKPSPGFFLSLPNPHFDTGKNQANNETICNLKRKRMCLWKTGATWPLPLSFHTLHQGSSKLMALQSNSSNPDISPLNSRLNCPGALQFYITLPPQTHHLSLTLFCLNLLPPPEIPALVNITPLVLGVTLEQ